MTSRGWTGGRRRTAGVLVAVTLGSLGGLFAGADAGSAAPTLPGPTDTSPHAYVTALGRDLTGRDPTPGLRASWERQLAAGTSRLDLTSSITRSDLAEDVQIRTAYRRVLGRPPSADWDTIWAERLRAGADVSSIYLRLYASGELYRALGSSSDALVDHLYSKIAGRRPSPADRRDAVRLLEAGYSRALLVDHLWRSTEAAELRVETAFRAMVDRYATAAERAAWRDELRVGDDRHLAATLAASDEYAALVPWRAGELHIPDEPLRGGTAGRWYRATLRASGGTPPYTYEVADLPDGLELDGDTVSGVPSARRSTLVQVRVVDSTGRSTARSVGLSITRPDPAPVVQQSPGAGPLDMIVVTPDRGDVYAIDEAGRSLTVRAPTTNEGHGLRALIVPRDEPEARSAATCATWASETAGIDQQGAALQVRVDGGRVRALTVTKNVVYDAHWVFNLHTFDTTRSDVFQRFGQIVLSRAFLDGDEVAPLPWSFCARVRGSFLELKAWPTVGPEPAWHDTRYGGRVRVPAGWNAAGRAGWFVGHLRPGDAIRYDDLRTGGLPTGEESPDLPSTERSTEVVAADRRGAARPWFAASG